VKIVVPYTKLSVETEEALAGLRVEYVDVSAELTSYFDLLNELWLACEDLIIVEQDIVINGGTIPGFIRCNSLWCAAPYPYLGAGVYAGLGCVRFRKALMEAHPDLMADVATHDYPGHSPMHWCTLDAAIQRELWARRRHACCNHRPVGHLHDWPTHGCVEGAPA
jgi:hypothetical protein